MSAIIHTTGFAPIIWGVLAFFIYIAVVCVIARVVGLCEREPRHPCSKDPVPTFPNFWRRGDRS